MLRQRGWFLLRLTGALILLCDPLKNQFVGGVAKISAHTNINAAQCSAVTTPCPPSPVGKFDGVSQNKELFLDATL